jgi:hypothetical protein
LILSIADRNPTKKSADLHLRFGTNNRKPELSVATGYQLTHFLPGIEIVKNGKVLTGGVYNVGAHLIANAIYQTHGSVHHFRLKIKRCVDARFRTTVFDAGIKMKAIVRPVFGQHVLPLVIGYLAPEIGCFAG